MLNRYASQLDADVSMNKQTILMTAAALGNAKLAEELLRMGADVNRRDLNGRTALHYAASVGAIPIFEMLVKNGAQVDGETIGGETPLMKAALFAQANVIEWYLNNSPDSFKKTNNTNETILQIIGKTNKELQKGVSEALQEL
jgi:ankyrin repeat protein